MARTAFHRRLGTITGAPSNALTGIAGLVKTLDAHLNTLATDMTEVKSKVASVTTAVTGVATVANSIDARTKTIDGNASKILARVILPVTKWTRHPTSWDLCVVLTQAEATTLDKTPKLRESNQVLQGLTKSSSHPKRLEALNEAPDLRRDFELALAPYKSGSDEERAHRFQAINLLKSQIVEHFAQQDTTSTKN
jgi:hypothetical protein